ncbi:MAG: ABC transporter ATP-binding protein [Eggerthellaceae bacterium]|nr:ABC transporter ATP-binding protein [Eggerthellaceae bacterium]
MSLVIDHLGFSYAPSAQIFTDISFEVEAGSVVCLLGPNGCGKTTLLNCVIGLHKATSGSVSVDGESIEQLAGAQVAQLLGYVPQEITAAFDYTVLDYVVTGCAPHMKWFKRPGEAEYARAWESLERMGIERLADQSYARISGGERQQVSIARVLTQKPAFILLDEPTSHLDFGNQIRVLDLVKDLAREGFGLLMTTHNPDHVLMLDGKVVAMQRGGDYRFGNARDIVTAETLHELYGIEIAIEHSGAAKRDVCIAVGVGE